MRGEIAYLKAFLSALLFLDNNSVYRSPFIPLYRVRRCPFRRAPEQAGSSLRCPPPPCVPQREGLGHLHGQLLRLAEV